MNATRAHVGLVLRTAGEQALANVLHVAELARQYEAGGGISFRGFVDELRAAAETAQAAEAPILEEGSDGVRMMTVHKAKGLEFPVVILADATCKLSRAEAGRWLDTARNLCALKLGGWAPVDLLLHDGEEAARDKAEAQRLTYVAATRARDLLVVPVDRRWSVRRGLARSADAGRLSARVRASRSQRPRTAARAFTSKDSVMNRPDGDPARPHTVAPGAYVFPPSLPGDSAELRRGRPESRPSPESEPSPESDPSPDPDSVDPWWDPHCPHLGATSSFGLRRDDLIVKDGDMFAIEERMVAYERWRARTRRRRGQGAAGPACGSRRPPPGPRMRRGTASITSLPKPPAIEIVALRGAADRPRGPRFGSLVHAVLATVPLDAVRTVVQRTAETQGRLLMAPDAEVRAAASSSRPCCATTSSRARSRGAAIRRETPMTWLQKDGTMIEGVLDLAFEENGVTVGRRLQDRPRTGGR